MSEKKKGKPYFWVTWITKLLAGENECGWAAWFKARHYYKKIDDGFDLEAWTATHNAMVTMRAAELVKDGYTVYVEGENDFKLVGKETGSTLAGKPDIVAVKEKNVLVSDCKSGKRRDSDWWQVIIYMFALPIVRKDLVPAGAKIRGEVCYQNMKRSVETRQLTKARVKDIVAMVKRLSSGSVKKVPSIRECRYCNISSDDCSARVEKEPHKEATTESF